jgi:regulator of sigma E protease
MDMDIMGSLSAFGGGLVGYLVPFLFVLTIVVFFHELGHFLIARLCGVKVIAFSIGFGPEIVGFNDRYGTRWKLSAIPLGGYVKFLGDDNAASVPDHEAAAAMSEADKKVAFLNKPVGSRAAVVAAGPIANFILAIVIFAIIFMTVGKQIASARVDAVQANSAAAAAGFKAGDLVTAINGQKIEGFSDMQRMVSVSAGAPLKIDVDRGGVRQTLTAIPELRELKDNFGNVHRVGVLGISRSMAPDDVFETENAFVRFDTNMGGGIFQARVGIMHPWEGFGASDRPISLSRPLIQKSNCVVPEAASKGACTRTPSSGKVYNGGIKSIGK